MTAETDPGNCSATNISGLALDFDTDGMLMPGEYYDACDTEDQLTVQYTLSGATVSDTIRTGTNAGLDTFNAGLTTLTYFVTDRAGNSTSCSMLVLVEDKEAPQFLLALSDTTVSCESVPEAPVMTMSDNCTETDNISLTFAETTTIDFMACDAEYLITRTWEATDEAGNTNTLTQLITVVDNTAPTFVALPDTVSFENDLNICGSLLSFDLTGDDATDNCSDTLTYSYNLPENGNLGFANGDTLLFEVGLTPVEVTVTDECGNATTEIVIIEVLDVEPPFIGCINNIGFSLPPSNTITIQPNLLVQVVQDNCTPDNEITLTLSQQTFDCEDATNTPIPVIITATDEYGNEAICKTDVTIQENVKPVALCKDVTVSLDFAGKASIQASMLDNGSTDNCGGMLSFAGSQTNFECADLGEVPVILTVTDPSGNTDNCAAIVTVIDDMNPIAECLSINAYLGPDGSVTVDATDLDDGSSDNCTASDDLIYSINGLSTITYICSEKGKNNVTFVVEDAYGNTDNCAAIITVLDTIPPMALCRDMEIILDGSESVTLDAMDFDNGSTDQCDSTDVVFTIAGSSNLIVDCNLFGENTIVLDVADEEGNSSQCEATLTVLPLDNVHMIMGSAQGPYNDTVYVPITVENFYAVTSFALSGQVVLDSVAKLVGVAASPALNMGNFQANVLNDGVFTISYFDVAGLSLSDGDTMAWVKVLMVGEENATTPITLGSTPLSAQVSQGCDPEAEPFLFTLNLTSPGFVTVVENTVHKVGGYILDNYGNPVCDVTIFVSGDITDTLLTNEMGYYEFLIESANDVCVHPYKNKRGKTLTGLPQPDILDALRIQTAVVTGNFGIIETPVKWLSADVQPNDGKNITVADAQRVQALVVSAITSFQPDHNFWNFVDVNYPLPATNSNPTVNYADSVCYVNVQEDKLNTDFTAFPMGDVTAPQSNSVMPVCDSLLFTGSSQNRSNGILEVPVYDRKLSAGEVYEIPFTVSQYESMVAAQLTLRFDPMLTEYLGWEAGDLVGFSNQSIGTANLADGQLGLAWYSLAPQSFESDQVLFTLLFRAKTDINSLTSILGIDGSLTENIAYNQDEESFIFQMVVAGSVTANREVSENTFALYQNKPNPFNGLTVIGFNLPKEDSAILRIFDAAGKEVYYYNGDFNRGYNEIQIEANDLPAKGLYYYQLETGEHTASKRMILLE